MSWYAKPSGGYLIDSEEAKANLTEIYNILNSTWTIEAIAGMCGNLFAESGLNPWRWQGDSVSLTSDYKGYGLPQFTPAKGYIYNYGVDVYGYAPNLSTTQITQGANPNDGYAQIIVINEDKARKFLDRRSYCTYADITNSYPFNSYKQLTDLYVASTGWLFNYEFPAPQYRTEEYAQLRYSYSQQVLNFLQGLSPTPPTPPDPPIPPIQQKRKMPLYMMIRKIY